MSARQQCRMTKAERNYASNPDNFESQEDYEMYANDIKMGDNAHTRGDYRDEASLHRGVQEVIYGQGFNKRDSASRHDFAWNSLYLHANGVIRRMQNGGMDFDESFHYDSSKRHYYLTSKGRNFCDNNGVWYETNGVSSLVNPRKGYYDQHSGGNTNSRSSYGFGISDHASGNTNSQSSYGFGISDHTHGNTNSHSYGFGISSGVNMNIPKP